MKLSDRKRIEAPREIVWAGLNDPEILQRSIPGCESLNQISDTEFEAEVRAKVGPVKAKFKGAVTLSDLNPPESYRISGEGKGGAAGYAKGGANITLTEEDGGTVLAYDVDADVGGKLAQIGGRLIEGTAKKLAGEFFNNFEAALQESGDAPAGTATATADEKSDGENTETETPAAPPPLRTVPTSGGSGRLWLAIGVVFVLGALALTLMQ